MKRKKIFWKILQKICKNNFLKEIKKIKSKNGKGP
jgi:hypothetical protein